MGPYKLIRLPGLGLLTSSSVSLSYFILAVPIRKFLGKHSCMSSPFPIAILNGTFFCSVKAMSNWKLSAIKQILLLLLVVAINIFYCWAVIVHIGRMLLVCSVFGSLYLTSCYDLVFCFSHS